MTFDPRYSHVKFKRAFQASTKPFYISYNSGFAAGSTGYDTIKGWDSWTGLACHSREAHLYLTTCGKTPQNMFSMYLSSSVEGSVLILRETDPSYYSGSINWILLYHTTNFWNIQIQRLL